MWSSNTSDNGPSTLVLGNDGVLALRRNSDNVVTWSSGKVPPPQPSAQTDKLTSGQAIWRGSMSLKSADGKNSLTLQDSDGNLVVRQGLAALWATGKFGSDIGWATVQEDGNFVVYNDKGEWQWASGTDGNGPSTLTMQNDGNLVLTRNSDGAETWSWRSGKH
jgi:hypothetical protein